VRNCGIVSCELCTHLGWDTSDGLLGGQKQSPQLVHERCGAVFVHEAEERHLHFLRVGDLETVSSSLKGSNCSNFSICLA
jgi:hypothetical protein